MQPETTLESDVVIPTHTKEMDEVKAAEEQIWKTVLRLECDLQADEGDAGLSVLVCCLLA